MSIDRDDLRIYQKHASCGSGCMGTPRPITDEDVPAILRALLTTECRRCEGRGFEYVIGVKHECAEGCSGGRVLAEGVTFATGGPYSSKPIGYVVPFPVVGGSDDE